ncbi:hypothetical protein HAX54_029233 [Datura stramonium]|uniref:Uncharacterized protein n=1 Tax=Datura stramonium TaxID=4076 RepID=A0ABS8SA67_DATST|nr:hypothetical protein [Datura stramonium]
MGAIYSLIVREEEILIEQRKKNGQEGGGIIVQGRDEEIELVIPPVFDNCTRVLDAEEQNEARELYWEGIYLSKGKLEGGSSAVEKGLRLILNGESMGQENVWEGCLD